MESARDFYKLSHFHHSSASSHWSSTTSATLPWAIFCKEKAEVHKAQQNLRLAHKSMPEARGLLSKKKYRKELAPKFAKNLKPAQKELTRDSAATAYQHMEQTTQQIEIYAKYNFALTSMVGSTMPPN